MKPRGSRFINTCLLLMFCHKLAAISIHKVKTLLLLEGLAWTTQKNNKTEDGTVCVWLGLHLCWVNGSIEGRLKDDTLINGSILELFLKREFFFLCLRQRSESLSHEIFKKLFFPGIVIHHLYIASFLSLFLDHGWFLIPAMHLFFSRT